MLTVNTTFLPQTRWDIHEKTSIKAVKVVRRDIIWSDFIRDGFLHLSIFAFDDDMSTKPNVIAQTSPQSKPLIWRYSCKNIRLTDFWRRRMKSLRRNIKILIMFIDYCQSPSLFTAKTRIIMSTMTAESSSRPNEPRNHRIIKMLVNIE